MPIVRTFAPFVAGIGRMNYLKFLTYSVFGSLLWDGNIFVGGFLVWQYSHRQTQFHDWWFFAIIGISLLPAIIEYWRSRRGAIAVKQQGRVTER
jgi:membrane-associated protein